jgi:hypothetical protein
MTSTVAAAQATPVLYDALDVQSIGGARRDGRGSGLTRVIDPYPGHILNEIRDAVVIDVDLAFETAHAIHAHAVWRREELGLGTFRRPMGN